MGKKRDALKAAEKLATAGAAAQLLAFTTAKLMKNMNNHERKAFLKASAPLAGLLVKHKLRLKKDLKK